MDWFQRFKVILESVVYFYTLPKEKSVHDYVWTLIWIEVCSQDKILCYQETDSFPWQSTQSRDSGHSEWAGDSVTIRIYLNIRLQLLAKHKQSLSKSLYRVLHIPSYILILYIGTHGIYRVYFATNFLFRCVIFNREKNLRNQKKLGDFKNF